jgi:hypothetical protein
MIGTRLVYLSYHGLQSLSLLGTCFYSTLASVNGIAIIGFETSNGIWLTLGWFGNGIELFSI